LYRYLEHEEHLSHRLSVVELEEEPEQLAHHKPAVVEVELEEEHKQLAHRGPVAVVKEPNDQTRIEPVAVVEEPEQLAHRELVAEVKEPNDQARIEPVVETKYQIRSDKVELEEARNSQRTQTQLYALVF
jgi:hypothetical protein